MRNMNWVVKLFVVLFSFFAVSACFGSMPREDSVFADKTPEGQITQLSEETFNDFELSPDGKTIAVGTETGTYVFSGEQFGLLIQTPYPADRVAFSPDGYILAIGYRNEIWLWDLRMNKVTYFAKTSDAESKDDMGKIIFSPDGQVLAIHTFSDGCDGTGRGFQLRSVPNKGKLIFHTKICLFWIAPVFNFSLDGKKLILGYADNPDHISVLDPYTGNIIQDIPDAYLWGVSSDGRTIARAIDEESVSARWFNLETQQFVFNTQLNKKDRYSPPYIEVSPDQIHFITFESENLYLFEISTNKKICDLGKLRYPRISFSKDGKQVLLWDIDTNHVFLWQATECNLRRSWQLQGALSK